MADAFEDSFDDLLDEPEFEPAEEAKPKKPRKKRNLGGCLMNVLSGILVAGTLIVSLIFLIIFVNPQASINPLPPTTLPALVKTWTPSPTPRPVLPPTWTPTTSPTTEPTATPTPTDTPSPSETPIPTADLASGTTFRVEDGAPIYEENTTAGCSWLGVAGEVFDKDGEPVPGILVEVGGTIGDEPIDGLTLTGMAAAYGESGYEILLAEAPAESDSTVYVQLLDQANLPLTEAFYFQTYDSCDSNLIKVNFVQVDN